MNGRSFIAALFDHQLLPLMLSTVFVMLVCAFGCGRIPILSESRKKFAPWEKLPEGNGIHYVEKLTRDPGVDPLYLCKMTYDDESALQNVINTFGLIQHQGPDEPTTFTTTLEPAPKWFPLDKFTDHFVFPQGPHEYVVNLWIDKKSKTMILERAWW